MALYVSERSRVSLWLFNDTRMAWLWLVVRLYLGWEWLSAGWEKAVGGGWLGAQAGTAITGFMQGALAKTGGAHPDVQWWYAWFITHGVLAHPLIWSDVIVAGEMLVGLGLIAGCLTGAAAFFGFVMNINFMLAGSVSVNPIWLILSLLLMLAWRTAGWWGIDRFVLPRVYKRLRRG